MIDLGPTISVTIRAPIEEVWNALTTPELIKRWFFSVDTETDWQVGSPLVHRGEWQGKPYEDKGTILRFEPPALLVHSHWSPASRVPDRPEHYQEVSWSLADHDGATTLTVAETNLPSEEAKAISEESWKAALTSLKDLLEA
jgi:uncharacterized protein YndB with AHSA1/START domain